MSTIVGGTIVWDLDADISKLNDGLNKASDKVEGIKGKMKDAERGSQAFAAGLAVVGAVAVKFGMDSVKAFNESTQAQTKLSTNLLNVKGNTLANVDALDKLASKLQSVGVIEDDVIKAGMSQLATFNLQGDTIARLTPKITDMVAQMKGHNATAEDMVGINNLVGKVMTGNIGALSRYGVTLSETQAELLKTGTETERANILNEVLAQNYGKVNEALRNTPQGQMTAFKNTMGDFQELLGEMISRSLVPITKHLNNMMEAMGGPEGMMRKFNAALVFINSNLPIIIGLIIGGLTPALYGMAAGFIAMMAPLVPFLIAGAAIGLLLKVLNERFDLLGKGMPILIGLLTTVGVVVAATVIPAFIAWATTAGAAAIATIIATAPLLLLAIAIGVVVAAIFWFAQHWQDVWNAIKAVIKMAWDHIAGVFNGIKNAASSVFDFLKNIWSGILNFFLSIGGRIVDALLRPFREAKEAIDKVAQQIRDVANKINPFNRNSPSLVDNVTRGLGIIKDEYESLKDISLPPIAHSMPAMALANPSPMNVLGSPDGASGSKSGAGATSPVNIYIDHVNDQQDVEALGREMGFRQQLIK